ncbi:hypothetical protein GW846_01550 [Candidatus Gracilibacteria bacterium]|nr:hypothetical protein [Candidatus Gracilibacteria bacterium]
MDKFGHTEWGIGENADMFENLNKEEIFLDSQKDTFLLRLNGVEKMGLVIMLTVGGVTTIMASKVRGQEMEQYYLYDDLNQRYEKPVFDGNMWDMGLDELKSYLYNEGFDSQGNPAGNILDLMTEFDTLKSLDFKKTLETWLISLYENTGYKFKGNELILLVQVYGDLQNHDYKAAENTISIFKSIFSWVQNLEYALDNLKLIPLEA